MTDDFRARLIAARERLGLSRKQMAKRLLTPWQTYQQWENGSRRTPGAAVVAAESLLPDITTRARVLTLADGKRTIDDIAEATGLTRATVKTYINKLRREGHTAPVRRRRRLPREGTIARRIFDLANGHRTAAEIGQILNRSQQNVRSHIKEIRKRGIEVLIRPARKGPPPGTPETREKMRRVRSYSSPLPKGSVEAMARTAKMRAARAAKRAPA